MTPPVKNLQLMHETTRPSGQDCTQKWRSTNFPPQALQKISNLFVRFLGEAKVIHTPVWISWRHRRGWRRARCLRGRRRAAQRPARGAAAAPPPDLPTATTSVQEERRGFVIIHLVLNNIYMRPGDRFLQNETKTIVLLSGVKMRRNEPLRDGKSHLLRRADEEALVESVRLVRRQLPRTVVSLQHVFNLKRTRFA